MNEGQIATVGEVIRDIKKYQSYLKFSKGGITVTGGEPFVQPDFLLELLMACKANGIHTALDTSGNDTQNIAEKVLKHTDLLLLDIKSFNHDTYKKLTGADLDRALHVLRLSESMKIPVWIRFVLVPGLTDNFDDLKKMAEFLRPFENVDKVEILPFHKMGEYKWKELGLKYELADVEPPSRDIVERAQALFEV